MTCWHIENKQKYLEEYPFHLLYSQLWINLKNVDMFNRFENNFLRGTGSKLSISVSLHFKKSSTHTRVQVKE